jgi:hypothetical protein
MFGSDIRALATLIFVELSHTSFVLCMYNPGRDPDRAPKPGPTLPAAQANLDLCVFGRHEAEGKARRRRQW